jgi:hypothetical protein
MNTTTNILRPAVLFNFNYDGTAFETAQTHANRLKTKLTTKQRIWNGKVVVHPKYSKEFFIFNALKQKTIKVQNVDFDSSNRAYLVDGGYAVPDQNEMSLYFIDSELCSCRLVFSSKGIDVCAQLQDKTIAIGSETGITLVNSQWKTIRSIPPPSPLFSRVFRIVQLKCGKIFTLHRAIGSPTQTALWNRDFTEPKLCGETVCTDFVQLDNGLLIGYGLGTEMNIFDPQTCQITPLPGDKTIVMKLQNGLYAVVHFLTNEVSIHDVDKQLYKFEYQLGYSWNTVYCEVRPGVLAWQVGRKLTLCDTERRELIEEFPLTSDSNGTDSLALLDFIWE